MTWKELNRFRAEFERADQPIAMATLVSAKGSSYRQPGARMLIAPDKHFVGHLSAGCLEDEIAELAQEVIGTGKGVCMQFDLRARFACDGSIEVFIERLSRPSAFIDGLARAVNERASILVATNYDVVNGMTGTRVLDEASSSTVKSAVTEPKKFLQLIEPPVRLLLFGEHFDVHPIQELASFLGWEAEIWSDLHGIPKGDSRTASVVMSHNFGRDLAALKHLFANQFGYIGLLGPRRRKQQLINYLIEEGYSPEKLSTLHSPAGLDIGAETAEEIALAIVAEIQAAMTDRTAGYLRERKAAIHSMEDSNLCKMSR
jgi:xanthine/CO dehydrogenase XdhC/CoxF family maturation factor